MGDDHDVSQQETRARDTVVRHVLGQEERRMIDHSCRRFTQLFLLPFILVSISV